MQNVEVDDLPKSIFRAFDLARRAQVDLDLSRFWLFLDARVDDVRREGAEREAIVLRASAEAGRAWRGAEHLAVEFLPDDACVDDMRSLPEQ
eukprot:7202722-Alexandrium_andersonii.AAC.1